MGRQFLENGKTLIPAIEKFVALFANRADREQVNHSEIAEAIGEPYRTRRYAAACAAGKRRVLLEHSRLLLSIPGQGYVVASPDLHIDGGRRTLAHAARRMRNAGAIFRVLEDERCTDEQKKVRDHAVERLHWLGEQIATTRRTLLPPQTKGLPQ